MLEGIACDAWRCRAELFASGALWCHTGGKLTWDAGDALFPPDPSRPPRGADGRANVVVGGHVANGHPCHSGRFAMRDAAGGGVVGGEAAGPRWTRPVRRPDPCRIMDDAPGREPGAAREDWLDYQNDVQGDRRFSCRAEGSRASTHSSATRRSGPWRRTRGS